MTTTHGWRATSRARAGRRILGLGLADRACPRSLLRLRRWQHQHHVGSRHWIGRQPHGIQVHHVDHRDRGHARLVRGVRRAAQGLHRPDRLRRDIVKAGDAGALTNKLVLTKSSPIADAVYGIDNAFAGRASTKAYSLYSPTLPPGASAHGCRAGRRTARAGRLRRRLRQRGHDVVRGQGAGRSGHARRPHQGPVPGLFVSGGPGDVQRPDWPFLARHRRRRRATTRLARTTGAGPGRQRRRRSRPGWTERLHASSSPPPTGKGRPPGGACPTTRPPLTIPKGGSTPTTAALLDTAVFRQVEQRPVCWPGRRTRTAPRRSSTSC